MEKIDGIYYNRCTNPECFQGKTQLLCITDLFDRYEFLTKKGEICPIGQPTGAKCRLCMHKHLGRDMDEYYEYVPCSEPEKYHLGYGRVVFKKGVEHVIKDLNGFYNFGVRSGDKPI